MKTLLLIALCIFNYQLYGMEDSEAPFPEEGFVEATNLEEEGVTWNYYDGGCVKHIQFLNLDKLHQKYRETIIKRKLGSAVFSFFDANPKDDNSLIIDRYTKAVCWQLVKKHRDNQDTLNITSQEITYAEGQIPYTIQELVFIQLGKETLSEFLKKKCLEDCPHMKQRSMLNTHLQRVKNTIEQKKDK